MQAEMAASQWERTVEHITYIENYRTDTTQHP